tara:strand:- start:7467 stop:8465 length:999 start_codon:yes stop_codon:yes gene_type:complete
MPNSNVPEVWKEKLETKAYLSSGYQQINIPRIANGLLERIDFLLTGSETVTGGTGAGAPLTDGAINVIDRIKIQGDGLELVNLTGASIYKMNVAQRRATPLKTNPSDDAAAAYAIACMFTVYFSQPQIAKPGLTSLETWRFMSSLVAQITFASDLKVALYTAAADGAVANTSLQVESTAVYSNRPVLAAGEKRFFALQDEIPVDIPATESGKVITLTGGSNNFSYASIGFRNTEISSSRTVGSAGVITNYSFRKNGTDYRENAVSENVANENFKNQSGGISPDTGVTRFDFMDGKISNAWRANSQSMDIVADVTKKTGVTTTNLIRTRLQAV